MEVVGIVVKHEWQVGRQEADTKLVNYIRDRLDGAYPARQIKRALEKNLCEVNGAVERFASRPLKQGDRVAFRVEELQQAEVKPPEVTWDTIYSDDALIICNKPPGAVVDTPQGLEMLTNAFGQVFLVHRLDRDTSGVLLLARTIEARKNLEEQFRRREVEKEYLAVVDGIPTEKQGEIKNFLGKIHSYQGQAIWGEVTRGRDGRLAHTVWKVVSRGDNASLIACEPKTGRTHQLRVHLKGMGHPILGDYQYARRFGCTYRPARCLLHAASIAFTHPVSGQKQRWRAPLPDDFRAALSELQISYSTKR